MRYVLFGHACYSRFLCRLFSSPYGVTDRLAGHSIVHRVFFVVVLAVFCPRLFPLPAPPALDLPLVYKAKQEPATSSPPAKLRPPSDRGGGGGSSSAAFLAEAIASSEASRKGGHGSGSTQPGSPLPAQHMLCRIDAQLGNFMERRWLVRAAVEKIHWYTGRWLTVANPYIPIPAALPLPGHTKTSKYCIC